MNKTSKYKNLVTGIYECECGKQYENFQSLNGHFSHCEIHRKAIGKSIRCIWRPPKGVICGWQNKTEEEIKEIHKKSAKTLSEEFKLGKIKGSFNGKHHTNETKKKMRLGMIKYKNKLYNCHIRANYNSNLIPILDEIAKEHGWHLQHAENGGEVFVDGYFLDAYDKENNIVVEYDEAKHYENGKLRDKDIERQNNIIDKLHCQFYRYNEETKILYKVN